VVYPLPALKSVPPLDLTLCDLVNMNCLDLEDGEEEGDPRIAAVRAIRRREFRDGVAAPFHTLSSSLRFVLMVELGVKNHEEFLALGQPFNAKLPWSESSWYLGRCGEFLS
jgi:hypothetical protein